MCDDDADLVGAFACQPPGQHAASALAAHPPSSDLAPAHDVHLLRVRGAQHAHGVRLHAQLLQESGSHVFREACSVPLAHADQRSGADDPQHVGRPAGCRDGAGGRVQDPGDAFPRAASPLLHRLDLGAAEPGDADERVRLHDRQGCLLPLVPAGVPLRHGRRPQHLLPHGVCGGARVLLPSDPPPWHQRVGHVEGTGVPGGADPRGHRLRFLRRRGEDWRGRGRGGRCGRGQEA
mmetsp:Transcript_58988/g.140309  ORF Transcript_58988/g.140309 Transcript_58988/m.140309 type:complete len:235 (-) Transcript_58988:116-820(-)